MEKEGFLNGIYHGLSGTCDVLMREMRLTFRDEGMLMFFFLVPLLYPLLYSWIYNNEVVREVPVAVVDMSDSRCSRRFIREYDASPDTRVIRRCNDMNEARALVERQDAHGIIYIPSDFAVRINRMQQAHVSVYCDMSLMLTYKAVYSTATAVAGKMGAGIQVALSGNSTGREDEITVQPLAVEEVPIFNSTGGYGNFIIPGVLMLILQQTLLMGIGLSAGTERERNRYKAYIPSARPAGGLFRVVFGKTLCYAMIYSVLAAYITLVVPRLFGFISLVRPFDLFMLLLPYLLACIFFSMCISSVVRYRENVILLVVFTSVPLLFLSGVSWPQSNIPGLWQGVSWLFPSTFGVRAFIRMNTMGALLQDVRTEYIALWIHTAVYFVLACVVYRCRIRRGWRF